jgi:cysteine synthase
MTKIYNNTLETIGKTPLIKLNRLTQGANATAAGKLESRNPGGRYLSTALFQEPTTTPNSNI